MSLFFGVALVEFRVKLRVEAALYQATSLPKKNMTYKKCPSLQSGSRSSAVAVRAISSHSAVGML